MLDRYGAPPSAELAVADLTGLPTEARRRSPPAPRLRRMAAQCSAGCVPFKNSGERHRSTAGQSAWQIRHVVELRSSQSRHHRPTCSRLFVCDEGTC